MNTALLLGPAGRLLRRGALLLIIILGLTGPAAQAQTVYGLGTVTSNFTLPLPPFPSFTAGQQGLLIINPTTGAATPDNIPITGITAGQTLVGMDFRPANGLLYALGYDASLAFPAANAQLYTLNIATRAATAVGAAIRLELGSTAERIGFDFNPVADRIRVVNFGDVNLRLNPNTGAIAGTDTNVAYAASDPNVALNPGIGAVAYTNSFNGTASTTLYDFDELNNGVLSIQNPPNNGTLNTVATVTFNTFAVGTVRAIDMDIYYDPLTATNQAYLTEVTATGSSNFYVLNLTTGAAIRQGNTVPAALPYEVRDIAVSIANLVPLTWTGAVSTAWAVAGNWSPPQVPTSTTDVTIPAAPTNQPAVSGADAAHNLTINTGASLTMTGGSLVVSGNLTNNGTITGSGTGDLIMNSGNAQVVGGSGTTRPRNFTIRNVTGVSLAAPVSVTGALRLLSGTLTTTGQVLTLVSNASGTALVDYTAGAVTGPVTAQRYVDGALNAGLGYRHFSSPVDGENVNTLATTGFAPVFNPAYNTSTTPGLTVPYPTVYGYNQARLSFSPATGIPDFDKGWNSPAAGAPLLPITGYTVNIGAGLTVDFTGTINTVSYQATNLGRGPQADAGWHLLGNPFPAPYNWDALVTRGGLTNVNNALYVFKSSGQYAGSYASYVNGIPANGGSSTLPVAQGYFVRVSAAGQTGQVDMRRADLLTADNGTLFQRGAADPRPQLALTLRNASAALQTAVYFEAAATAGPDPHHDADFLPAPNGLTLATEAGAEPLSINGLPALTGADVRVPLRLAGPAGSYQLATDHLLNLPAAYRAYLLDARTGQHTELTAGSALPLTVAAGAPASGRYSLLFSTQPRTALATAPAALARLASLAPNPAHGTVSLLLPNALRNGAAVPVQVLDGLGRRVRSLSLGAADEALTISLHGLAPGVYAVQARTAAGLISKKLVVE